CHRRLARLSVMGEEGWGAGNRTPTSWVNSPARYRYNTPQRQGVSAKGSGTVAGTARRGLRTTVPDPFADTPSVRPAGLEPTISGVRGRRKLQTFPRPESCSGWGGMLSRPPQTPSPGHAYAGPRKHGARRSNAYEWKAPSGTRTRTSCMASR